MALKSFVLTIVIMALVTSISYASDPNPLQDFCVAINDPKSHVLVNGRFCKNPEHVTADDFFTSGLNMPGIAFNQFGVTVASANVLTLPGLNTLGISLVRFDYPPYGLNAPHTNPRESEILVVVEGTLYVGFVTSTSAPNEKNRLFSKILHPGDVFVFPMGLIHFQLNVGKTKAVAFAALNSQLPGLNIIANASFGSHPPINDDILAKAFQVDKKIVDYIQSQFESNNY
ncbi:Germin-like protein subfamily 1 member 18 [Capsicum annuum]|uniref:germin-like protein subfamily 1 member 17 n=1 Tax=Capsicum annuum TaxID=4072 RepID=UPI0007BFDFD1|nr:germin-like protein subfamily 1 member 17 [Capsicum annuum]KAF3670659.1 Germin-like protein subfamily 1 member 18 [Capsicum annuum]